MPSSARPRAAWSRRRSRPLLIPAILVVLSLLPACGVRDRIVLQPIAPQPVSEELTAHLPAPKCSLPAAEVYAPERLESERRCLSVAEAKARNRHSALASAVLAGETAVAELIKQQSR